jgi:hypothetical protein
MAQIAIALAGAGAAKLAVGAGAVGSTIFGTSTVGAGYMLGSMLGDFLFAPKSKRQEGPRLQDLSVQGSSYGNFIPITYGSIRLLVILFGQLILLKDELEKK